MVVAELECYVSRPIAPTRRVALGDRLLPVNPAPGPGGVLLGGIAAHFATSLDAEELEEIEGLTLELEWGRSVPQPRLRHRFQVDRIGLQPCAHRLVSEGDEIRFELEEEIGTPAQHVLCVVYAAGGVPEVARATVMAAVRQGLRWRGALDRRLVAALSGRSAASTLAAVGDPVQWALDVLDLTDIESGSDRRTVQRAFRTQLLTAHPDHGGEDDLAARRIAELTEARRILFGA